MAEHEPSGGRSDDWLTPPSIFERLGLVFDLDPCSAGVGLGFVPARKIYTKADGGLAQPWHGLVFCNPPFGGRRGHVPWLVKFLDHANGIAIVRAYTSCDWWRAHVVPRAELLLGCRCRGAFAFGAPGRARQRPVPRVNLARGGPAARWRRTATRTDETDGSEAEHDRQRCHRSSGDGDT